MIKPLVSYVVPVYNKSHAVQSTLASLLRQAGPFDAEFIFVDDASTDNSVAILENYNDERITVIKNSDNHGPAVRLNQGARASNGDFLQFVDADDILARGATAEMLQILLREKADVIYGKWQVTSETAESLLRQEVPPGQRYEVSDRPLQYVLTHKRIVRMVLMTTRSCFTASGGCDETIFVQDESLPLRLAAKAERFVDYSGITVYVPAQDESNLSYNKIQQHHDGFCAYRNAMEDLQGIDALCAQLLNKKAMSIVWKHYRRNTSGSIISTLFLKYLCSKIFPSIPSSEKLDKLYELFDPYSGQIRRPDAQASKP